MAILTREAILEAQDLKRETISVKRWGGEVIVTEMTAARRLEFERLFTEVENRMRVLLVAFAVVDEAGKPLFSVKDVEALGEKNFRAVYRVSQVALRLNRVGEAEELELQENFPGSQG